ncbi:helix-turn-helix transcriptional regulator [Saccharothrix australiensis]|uniref:DNA-binding CsgD family transcriptional regulator n=1 Tax=Saccharothrix australiensis TaxID=2072 RepID=A0A495W208_9PSEU|nr:helix-turn-helix transcriptional regulator [Saccharothrix australiensis]RKT55721.1 DNA-binding CsgD family transcriptional regulator [Saccharothrix australiensis]
MRAEWEAVRDGIPTAAAGNLAVEELGALFSRQVGRLIPHDGYMLTGLDPVSGAGCFYAKEHGYSAATAHRVGVGELLGVDPFLLDAAPGGLCVIDAAGGPLGGPPPDPAVGDRQTALREVMAAEGVGVEMTIVLADGGRVWGTLIVVRERGRRSFSAEERRRAERLRRVLAAGVRRFVADRPLRPSSHAAPPGVFVVGADGAVLRATPSAGDWLAQLLPHATRTPGEHRGAAWHLAALSHHRATETVCRVPTPSGFVELRAQPLSGGAVAEVAVTAQPASGRVLLSAAGAWHGLTRREVMVLEQALEGMPAKQIARRLALSVHTVRQHLDVVYRKTGVNSREELSAALLRGGW